MTRSSGMFAAASEMFQAALHESRVETAVSESRVARLKAAAELERAGERERAAELIAQVRAEQEAERDA